MISKPPARAGGLLFGAKYSTHPFASAFFVALSRENGHTLITGRKFAPVSEDTVRTQIAWSLCLFLLFTVLGHAQSQNPRSQTQRIDGNVAPIDANDENRDRLARDMAKKANLERQAALKVDTDKLFKLAAELKGYVDKSNENVLSLEVLKKAEEIEKLARSVKDKMKGPN
jgi:hypothetical protein